MLFRSSRHLEKIIFHHIILLMLGGNLWSPNTTILNHILVKLMLTLMFVNGSPLCLSNHKRLYTCINRFNLLHPLHYHLLIHLYPYHRIKILYINLIRWVLRFSIIKCWVHRHKILWLIYNHVYQGSFIHKMVYHFMGCHKRNLIIHINRIQVILIWFITLVDRPLGSHRCKCLKLHFNKYHIQVLANRILKRLL